MTSQIDPGPPPILEDDEVLVQSTEIEDEVVADWIVHHEGIILSVSILLFGAVVIGLAMHNTPKSSTIEQRLRFFATILVIVMAVFLVVAGYGKDQIAAPLGLLGTIAGYLLGRQDNGGEATSRSDAESPPAH